MTAYQLYLILIGIASAILISMYYINYFSKDNNVTEQITNPDKMKVHIDEQISKLERFKHLNLAGLSMYHQNAAFYDLIQIHKDITKSQVCTLKLLPNTDSDLVRGSEIKPQNIYLYDKKTDSRHNILYYFTKDTITLQIVFNYYVNTLLNELNIIKKELNNNYERL